MIVKKCQCTTRKPLRDPRGTERKTSCLTSDRYSKKGREVRGRKELSEKKIKLF